QCARSAYPIFHYHLLAPQPRETLGQYAPDDIGRAARVKRNNPADRFAWISLCPRRSRADPDHSGNCVAQPTPCFDCTSHHAPSSDGDGNGETLLHRCTCYSHLRGHTVCISTAFIALSPTRPRALRAQGRVLCFAESPGGLPAQGERVLCFSDGLPRSREQGRECLKCARRGGGALFFCGRCDRQSLHAALLDPLRNQPGRLYVFDQIAQIGGRRVTTFGCAYRMAHHGEIAIEDA
ncbi:MAG: hypothetical protein V7640_3820, partial [Betaproteobacteria bacterium]